MLNVRVYYLLYAQSALGSYGSSARQDSIALPFELPPASASCSPSSSSTLSASTTASVTCTPRSVTLATVPGSPAAQTVSGVECVFYLTVKSIVVPQRLKGTLTYVSAPLSVSAANANAQAQARASSAQDMAEAASEAASCEKLDFSLPVPCYSYLLAQQSCSPYAIQPTVRSLFYYVASIQVNLIFVYYVLYEHTVRYSVFLRYRILHFYCEGPNFRISSPVDCSRATLPQR